jgi:hypothetical protein
MSLAAAYSRAAAAQAPESRWTRADAIKEARCALVGGVKRIYNFSFYIALKVIHAHMVELLLQGHKIGFKVMRTINIYLALA